MGIFKFLFGKEKEEAILPEEEVAPEGSIKCDHCGKYIFSYEKRTKLNGKRLHRKCFKKLKKEAMQMAYSG